MFEIKAELFKSKVYLCAEDIIKLLDGSVKGAEPSFAMALRMLSSHLREIEKEAETNVVKIKP